MKSNEIAHSGSDSNEIAHSGSGSNLDPALKKSCDDLDAAFDKFKQIKQNAEQQNKLDDVPLEYYFESPKSNWKQIGLGLLGAFLGVTAASAGSRRHVEQDEEVADINRPINLEHTNPIAIRGCVLEEDAQGHVFVRYKCQYCGFVSHRQYEVHRARMGGTKTGGVFNCGNRCPQQPYEILHSSS